MKDIAAWSEYCKTLAPAISEACVKAPVAAGPGTLTKELGKALPDWHFRHAFCRGGWYRLGGVVDGQGQKVADDLESWAEAALADHDGDIQALVVAEPWLFEGAEATSQKGSQVGGTTGLEPAGVIGGSDTCYR